MLMMATQEWLPTKAAMAAAVLLTELVWWVLAPASSSSEQISGLEASVIIPEIVL